MDKDRQVPTLNDVARAAGVSTATVSRCLNSPDRVVKDTRERVLKAVQALGYTPNFGAQMMAAKRTRTIGAIVPTLENAIFARGLQAFQEELHRRGYTLLMASSAYAPEIEAEQIRTLVARGADGLLLIGHERDPQIYEYLQTQGVPVLVAWTYGTGNPQTCVGFDNRAAMEAMTQEVLSHGHRRIAVISGRSAGNDRVKLRLKGIAAAVAVAGLDPQQLQQIETDYDVDSGADAFDQLMRSSPRPTAVICGNDVLAVGALRRAKELGIAVPEEVSITGFDDMELARIVSPTLTSVHVPHHEMGLKAAETLIAMVEKTGGVESREIGTKLAIRASLGPAQGS
ncbi:MAG: LacI family DNA-binding transcriptional regulator [Pseudomonadota bacterium]